MQALVGDREYKHTETTITSVEEEICYESKSYKEKPEAGAALGACRRVKQLLYRTGATMLHRRRRISRSLAVESQENYSNDDRPRTENSVWDVHVSMRHRNICVIIYVRFGECHRQIAPLL